MIYIPFEVGCGLFTALNMAGSAHCWYVSGRRVMLATGALDSLIGATAVWAYPYDVHFANFAASAGATTAGFQFLSHGVRSSRLWRPKIQNYLYLVWVLGLFYYGYDRGRYAWALRYD